MSLFIVSLSLLVIPYKVFKDTPDIVSDLDYQKLNLMLSKKLYIPYLEDDEYEKESQKLRDYIRKAEERLTPEIRDNKIASLFNDNLD